MIASLSQVKSDGIKIEAYRVTQDFALFVKKAWPIIEPGTTLLWNWHLDALCTHLQAVYERRIHRLLINISPGHAKSSIVSVLFPDWCFINDPSIRWLCASHSIDLSIRDNKYRRDLIESEWFQARFGNLFQLSSSQNVKSFFENNHRGYSMAVAVRSSGTGKRGSYLLIDDPNNAMAGEADIQAVKEWFGKTWMSRLNDQENGPMVVVGQRLHEQDLSGHILELGGWTHLNLPEEFEPETKCETGIGWSDPRTVEGELLWPEKFPTAVLDKLKRGLGPVNYAAQYQQRPVPATGNVLNINHRRWFSIDETTGCYLLETPRGIKPVFKKDCWLFATVDLAVSEKQSADFTVLQAWAVTPFNDLLLLDVVRDHFTHPEQQAQIGMFHQRFGFQFVAVESVAYQLSLVQDLLNDGIPVKPYRPQTDKVTRASTVAIWYANGKVYHQKDMPWLYAFEKEIFTFPKAAKDDQMDCTSLAGIVVCNAQTPGVWDPNDTATIPDTTASIEEILDATQITEERRLAAEEEQAAIPVDPFAWAELHVGGGW